MAGMIAVNLKRNWFDPHRTLRRASHNPHHVSADWEEILPKGTEVIGKVDPKHGIKSPAPTPTEASPTDALKGTIGSELQHKNKEEPKGQEKGADANDTVESGRQPAKPKI